MSRYPACAHKKIELDFFCIWELPIICEDSPAFSPPKDPEMEKKSKKSEEIRLNVFIQEHGVASRRKADEMIESGLVKINGKIIKTLGTKVTKGDEVIVDGKKLGRRPSQAIYLFHKPYLTMTTRSDERSRPTIFDIPMLKKLPGNVQPVGRLDFKSEGLLLLTNDGDLALALSHPKYAVEKTYSVLLSTQISPEEFEKLKKGVQLEDGLAKPTFVKLSQREKFANSTGQWIEISVAEGRNRLVRRMMESLGLKVVRLVRISIGNIRLPSNLLPGKLRPISDAEKEYLMTVKKNMEDKIPSKKTVKSKTVNEQEKTKKKPPLSEEHYSQKIVQRQKKLQAIARERKNTATAVPPSHPRKKTIK
jgi:23S rRNA pseudouridine2605 synthase